ncbi:DUF6279 family lipoprotein [Ramlibacter albus]|nr:DUF6279 family lipoprotein [Ramlibacter albus]
MFLLLCVAMLPGCSTLKLAYNTLPEVAYWWFDGYGDFSDEQAPRVREELARLQAWHRANELPKLAEMLGRMEQAAPGSVTPQQACAFTAEAQARLVAVAEYAEPAAAGLAATLAPAQVQHVERRFAKRNAEWRKEWIDPAPAERQEKRFKQFSDRLESLYGPLEEPQRAVLRRGVAQSVFDPQRALVEWQRRQTDLLQVLRQMHERPANPQFARTALQGWRERVLRSPDAAYRKYQQELLDENCRMFAAIHESTNADQRGRAARRLRAWQRDLKELAAPQ